MRFARPIICPYVVRNDQLSEPCAYAPSTLRVAGASRETTLKRAVRSCARPMFEQNTKAQIDRDIWKRIGRLVPVVALSISLKTTSIPYLEGVKPSDSSWRACSTYISDFTIFDSRGSPAKSSAGEIEEPALMPNRI